MELLTSRETTVAHSQSGFTLFEVLLSMFFLVGAILTIISVLSRDMSIMTRSRTDFVGQTALRARMEYRRTRPFNDATAPALPAPGAGCQQFTTGDGAANLAALPYGKGYECVTNFEVDGTGAGPARRRLLTVYTKVYELPTTDANPNIRTYRAAMVLYQDGLNRQ